MRRLTIASLMLAAWPLGAPAGSITSGTIDFRMPFSPQYHGLGPGTVLYGQDRGQPFELYDLLETEGGYNALSPLVAGQTFQSQSLYDLALATTFTSQPATVGDQSYADGIPLAGLMGFNFLSLAIPDVHQEQLQLAGVPVRYELWLWGWGPGQDAFSPTEEPILSIAALGRGFATIDLRGYEAAGYPGTWFYEIAGVRFDLGPSVPEPGTLALAAAGIGALLVRLRRRRPAA
ncbi:MAG: PEP-CTERM sorting domain-containing protein [Bryobacteraceae bacterium]|nr:PEP-CTERM sorting domain-containing protein [Bryobacteraceae bacterium]